jgi:hypothetical protein
VFKLINRISARLEGMKLPLSSWLIIFFSISYLRNLLEVMLEKSRAIGVGPDAGESFRSVFLLFTLEWAALAAVLVIIFHILAKTPVEKLFKIVLAFLSIILIVPLIDFFAYFPAGSRVDYIYTVNGFFKALCFFFYFPAPIGVSLGVRLEVLLSALIAFLYTAAKTRSFSRAFAAAVLLYFFAVSSMCFPVFITAPILAFKGAAADAFIHNFFYTGAWPDNLTSRDGIMISFILVPLLLLCLYFHIRGKFPAFMRLAFFNRTSLLYVSLIMCGFFSAARLPEMAVANKFFEQPFMPFYAASAALLALLAAAAASLLSAIDDKKTRASFPYAPALVSVMIIAAILSLCLSFHVFMAILPVFLLLALLKATPFKNSPEALKLAARVVILFFVLFSGYAAVYGAKTPQIFSLTDTLLYLCILTAVQLSLTLKKPGYGVKIAASNFAFISYLVFPLIYRDWRLMIVSVICGLVSVLAMNIARLEKQRETILMFSLSVFLLSLCFLA